MTVSSSLFTASTKGLTSWIHRHGLLGQVYSASILFVFHALCLWDANNYELMVCSVISKQSLFFPLFPMHLPWLISTTSQGDLSTDTPSHFPPSSAGSLTLDRNLKHSDNSSSRRGSGRWPQPPSKPKCLLISSRKTSHLPVLGAGLKLIGGVPIVAQGTPNRRGTRRLLASIPGLTQGWGPCLAVSCGVHRRRDFDLALLWLWCGPAAVAQMGLLAWDPPMARVRPRPPPKQPKTLISSGNEATLTNSIPLCLRQTHLARRKAWNTRVRTFNWMGLVAVTKINGFLTWLQMC